MVSTFFLFYSYALTSLSSIILDYGESHYIGPIKGAQPNSEAWVNGFDHQAWLRLNSYFSIAFKTGIYPRISRDEVYIWARPHPKSAVAANDSVPRPKNWQLVRQFVVDESLLNR